MVKLRCFLKSIRWFEIAVRMGAPLIALLLSVPVINLANSLRILHALCAYFFLWAHLYTFNEWLGFPYDRHSSSKLSPLLSGKISQSEMLLLSVVFASVSILLYALLDVRLLFIVVLNILIGILYAHPKILLKNVALASFVILFIVSINDFFLGWIVFSPLVYKGLFVGFYFGILGIVGQHYHEAGDYEADKSAGINTNAVRFGKQSVFIFGFIFYSLSCLYFFFLTFLELIPRNLYSILLVTYPLYLFLFYVCMKSNLQASEIHGFVIRYRILYSIIGLYMIAQLVHRHLKL